MEEASKTEVYGSFQKELRVDFGKILDKWEKETAGTKGQKPASIPMNLWLKSNGVYDKDAASPGDNDSAVDRSYPGKRRQKLLRKRPDAVIDLHGLTIDEAWPALEVFFENSREKGFEKVLIIHGKGNHRNPALHGGSPGANEAMMRNISRRFIENCPFAGESGYSAAREGGRGATWVILKEKEGNWN